MGKKVTKHISLWAILLLLLSFGTAFAVDIANVVVCQTPTGLVLVRYDLFGGGDFTISLEVSQDGGGAFQIHPRSAIRDLGEDILPGQGKEIIWFSQADNPGFDAREHVFRILAIQEDSMQVGTVESNFADFKVTDSTECFPVAPITPDDMRELLISAGLTKKPGQKPGGGQVASEAPAPVAPVQPNDWKLIRQQAIRQMVTTEQPELQKCYLSYHDRNLELAGRVSIRFTVRADGYVEDVEFVEHEWNDKYNGEKVEYCVQSRIEGWRFPPAPAGLSTQFSLDFGYFTKPQYRK